MCATTAKLHAAQMRVPEQAVSAAYLPKDIVQHIYLIRAPGGKDAVLDLADRVSSHQGGSGTCTALVAAS